MPIAFVVLVHAMYLGDHAWRGREPTRADSSIWPGPIFIGSFVLFILSLPASIVAFFAGAYACAIEHGERRHRWMWTAIVLAVSGPMAIGVMKLDPVGAFDWWFD